MILGKPRKRKKQRLRRYERVIVVVGECRERFLKRMVRLRIAVVKR